MLENSYNLSYPNPKRRGSSKKILYSLLFLIISYLITCLVFFKLSLDKNLKAYQSINDFRPDLIAVFTGHSGRINLALKIAKKHPNARVFITGVNKQNTLNTLMDRFNLQSNSNIDYTARNTVENGIETLRMLRKNPELKNVLIISHDYHLIRINLIMNKLQRENENYKLHFLGRKTNFSSYRNLKILSKEVIKLLRTHLLFLFWSPS
jgi:uncharacterized SAM-binding protein YcdF (DUF218 family)